MRHHKFPREHVNINNLLVMQRLGWCSQRYLRTRKSYKPSPAREYIDQTEGKSFVLSLPERASTSRKAAALH